MATSLTGKEIFDGLVQYPLPKKSGVKDYIFYLIPTGFGYGGGASDFLGRFYKDHVAKDVGSVEEMIDALYAEVTAGVQQIREIIIVDHATPQAMQAKVLSAPTDDDVDRFGSWTAWSMWQLQQDFKAGKLAQFKQRRDAVVACLLRDSWITIRACRIGLAEKSMYSFFSFFGGRANVYAPKEYQFFGSQAVVTPEYMKVKPETTPKKKKRGPEIPPPRFTSRLAVHQHLVKQHYLPTDEHTPDRKDAIVEALWDPAKFSEPFVLASMMLTTPPQPDPYESLLDDLNGKRVSAALQAAFTAANFPLSAKASIQPKMKDHLWLVEDEVAHEDGPYPVVYQLEETITDETHGKKATLTASGRVYDPTSPLSNPTLPLQLFFFQGDEDAYNGKLARLAAYSDLQGIDSPPGQIFEALSSVLDSNEYSDGTVDLKAMFKSELDVDLPEPPIIQRVWSNGIGEYERVTWTVAALPAPLEFQVKQELPVASDGSVGHSITIVTGAVQLLDDQAEMMTYLGQDPDSPGTELAAYLNQFSLDELGGLVDYLRAPYRPRNAYYIRHAQEALQRKFKFEPWLTARLGIDPNTWIIPDDSYSELKYGEKTDLAEGSYEFDFNVIWREVRESFPSPTAFQTDLFTEEDLGQKLGLSDKDKVGLVVPDAPETDTVALKSSKTKGREKYIATDKDVIDVSGPSDLGCDDFRIIVTKWKELQGESLAKMKEQLSELVAPDGKSFLDHLWSWFMAFNKVNAPFEFLEMVGLGKSIPAWIGEHVFEIEEFGMMAAFLEIILPAVMPLIEWIDMMKEQQEYVEEWERRGKLVAIRQWLEELATLAEHGTVPDEPEIDLGDDFHRRYDLELGLDPAGNWEWEDMISYPSDFKDGFDEGKEIMERAGKEIVAKSDEAVAEVFARLHFDACKLSVLKDLGILDPDSIRSQAIATAAHAILNKLPSL